MRQPAGLYGGFVDHFHDGDEDDARGFVRHRDGLSTSAACGKSKHEDQDPTQADGSIFYVFGVRREAIGQKEHEGDDTESAHSEVGPMLRFPLFSLKFSEFNSSCVFSLSYWHDGMPAFDQVRLRQRFGGIELGEVYFASRLTFIAK